MGRRGRALAESGFHWGAAAERLARVRAAAREAERAELQERKVEAYKALGRATGLDVDAMEREAAIERAREEAEAEARRRELYAAGSDGADNGE